MKYFLRSLNNSLFKKYLLTTNIVSSGFLFSVGDGVSQYIEHKMKKSPNELEKKPFAFNWDRSVRMFVIGAAGGPIHHFFYGWLDRKYPGATIRTTSIKILYDQLIMSPLCIVLFFYSAGWIYGQSNAECSKELKEKFAVVLVADWLTWPAAQFVNFHYLHPKYRVLYVNFVTMIYDIFLSWVKHNDIKQSIRFI